MDSALFPDKWFCFLRSPECPYTINIIAALIIFTYHSCPGQENRLPYFFGMGSGDKEYQFEQFILCRRQNTPVFRPSFSHIRPFTPS